MVREEGEDENLFCRDVQWGPSSNDIHRYAAAQIEDFICRLGVQFSIWHCCQHFDCIQGLLACSIVQWCVA